MAFKINYIHMKKPYETYLQSLEELYNIVDRARLRAAELRGQQTATGHEEPSLLTKAINSSMKLEADRLASVLVVSASNIDKIKFTDDDGRIL